MGVWLCKFENTNHINIFCSENLTERIHGWFTFNSIVDVPFLYPRWLPLLLAEISNGLRKESSEIVLCHLECILHYISYGGQWLFILIYCARQTSDGKSSPWPSFGIWAPFSFFPEMNVHFLYSNGLRKESSEIVLCHLEVKLKISRAITCSWMSLVVHSIPVQFLTNAYHYELPLSQYRKWTFIS
jgi:hypothetical protein